MRMIFVNLPVRDLPASKAFFAALGFGFPAQFTNDAAACQPLPSDRYRRSVFPAKLSRWEADTCREC